MSKASKPNAAAAQFPFLAKYLARFGGNVEGAIKSRSYDVRRKNFATGEGPHAVAVKVYRRDGSSFDAIVTHLSNAGFRGMEASLQDANGKHLGLISLGLVVVKEQS